MSARKRKTNYVDKRVQGALVRRIALHWFCFFVVAGCAVLGMQLLLGDASQTIEQRLAEKTRDLSIYGVVILALFPAFLLDTVRFSNRFVGPVSRLHQAMTQLSSTGTTPDLKFRDGDFWTELATEFNNIKEQVAVRSSDTVCQEEVDV